MRYVRVDVRRSRFFVLAEATSYCLHWRYHRGERTEYVSRTLFLLLRLMILQRRRLPNALRATR